MKKDLDHHKELVKCFNEQLEVYKADFKSQQEESVQIKLLIE